MTRIVCHADLASIPAGRNADDVHVLLYEKGTIPAGVATIGSRVFDTVARLGTSVHRRAFDFLTISMAVTAADTFVSRMDTHDRWSRSFDVRIPLIEPDLWEGVRGRLEATLAFLSGDRWRFEFVPDGPMPPNAAEIGRKRKRIDISRVDCVSLFSGGLDSYLGVVDLMANGNSPLLISHSYPGDAGYQKRLATTLPAPAPRFLANAHPSRILRRDTSMRTRSFNFLAYGIVASSAVSRLRGGGRVPFYIPENGQIALNPPLTPRRTGSLSTRTAHPHFLDSVQAILDQVGIPVDLSNPHALETKGEMLDRYAAVQTVRSQSVRTVSCGKWKREGVQCGCCVPCLIRRSAFQHAGIPDTTRYVEPDLGRVLTHASLPVRDDLIAMLAATKRADTAHFPSWVAQAGPLPEDPDAREAYVDVFRRGMIEMRAFLNYNGVI